MYTNCVRRRSGGPNCAIKEGETNVTPRLRCDEKTSECRVTPLATAKRSHLCSHRGPELRHQRGCTLAGSKVLEFCEDRKSVIFGVWAAPRAAQTPTMTDFRSLKNSKFPRQSTATSSFHDSASRRQPKGATTRRASPQSGPYVRIQ